MTTMTYESYCAGLDEICDRYGDAPSPGLAARMNAQLEAFKASVHIAERRPAATATETVITNAVVTALADAHAAGKTAAKGRRRARPAAAPAPRVAAVRRATAEAAPPPVPAPEPRAMSNRELARATVAGMDGAPSPFFSGDRGPRRERQVSPFMRAFSNA